MIDALGAGFEAAQQWLFESLLQPLMFAAGLGNLLEDGYTATGWLLVGLIQLLVLVTLIAPLQRWRPAQLITDRSAVRTDVIYTLVHRLGLFRVGLFLALDPALNGLFGLARARGLGTLHVDQVWSGVTDQPLVSFAIYLVLFDFLGYGLHRAQHRWNWWWALHSLHHSQRQLTMWSDNRNHLLSDLLTSVAFVLVAQAVGVAPGQFIALVAFTQLSESFQHANVRIHFGRVGERLWISPRFHRLHHSVGIGHESSAQESLGGHNFGVLLPWWDMLLGTANFDPRFHAPGVRDQFEPDAQGRLRDYGRGFWAQQRLGLMRLLGRA